MIYKTQTKESHLFIIKDDKKMIGKISTKRGGLFYYSTEEPFRKFNAFGINKELLLASDIKFEYVMVFCAGKRYLASRKKIIKEGIEHTFSFGTKLFLPINKWMTDADPQLSLEFN